MNERSAISFIQYLTRLPPSQSFLEAWSGSRFLGNYIMTQTDNEGKLDPRQNAQSNSETNDSENQEIAAQEKLSLDNTLLVEVVELGELSEEELKERLRLERKVERAFYEAGKALMELRDKRLYRSSHKTFEEYCRDRFGHTRQKSNYLIAAADVFENLTTIGCQTLAVEDLTKYSSQILPTNERQVRPLTKLEPESQWEAWQRSIEEAGGKVPSARIVKDVVERIMERTKVPNPYRVGEVCQIIPKDNPELKGKSGCWCIVNHVGDCSCAVMTWDTEYTVKLENIKSLDYLEEECAFMEQLCLRLKKLHQLGNLDTAAYWVLNGIGKLSTPYLTPLQEKLLGVLEIEYAVELHN